MKNRLFAALAPLVFLLPMCNPTPQPGPISVEYRLTIVSSHPTLVNHHTCKGTRPVGADSNWTTFCSFGGQRAPGECVRGNVNEIHTKYSRYCRDI